jgi:Zn finger protein HypA/HybF involved in hydrogenase expression
MKKYTANWHNDGNRFHLTVPFSKVDEEKRTVSGFASLDNVDRQGDLVTAEASQKAFDRFRGNIREMHQPIAVGKILSFKQQEFYDNESGETYKGVYVTTYISRGANDTWEKVLDGTLTGFSIGGNIIDSDNEFDKSANKSVRKINDYELYELSLVDNPANPLANIFSIQKGIDGLMVKGSITDIHTENVFWCKDDEIAIASDETNASCPACEENMQNIGWVEDIEETKSLDIKNLVKKYTEGGTDMSDELAVESVDVEENVDDVEEVATEEVAEETVDVLEKSDSADETVEEAVEEVLEKSADSDVTDELDIVKMLDDLKAAITDKIDNGLEKASGAASDSKQYVDEMLNSVKKSIDDLMGSHGAVQKTVEELSKRMDNYEAATAVKKSNDLDGSMEQKEIKKSNSIWNGHFLNVQDL